MSIQRVSNLPHVPLRKQDSHKGTFGRVLIVAGSPGMSGAAVLSGLGALRSGAGLVYIATSKSVLPIVASAEPSYLTIPLIDDDSGRLKKAALEAITSASQGKDAIAIGPGLGVTPATRKIVRTLFESVEQPMVIDADGLNCLAEEKIDWKSAAGPRVLTPHPGEFARLIDSDISTVQQNREELAVTFAADAGVVLLLKGAGTIVTDGERVYTNTTGNAGMSTGGTGDVLTGIITALLAQKFEPFAAAQLGAFLHGLAGDIAAEELTHPGLIASDLPQYLPKAWKRLQQG